MTPVCCKKSSSRRLMVASMMMILAAILAACSPAPAAPTQPLAATEVAAATEVPAAITAPTEAPTEAPTASAAQEPTAAPTEAAQAPAPAAVSFSNEVMPVFEQSCIKCHGGADGEKGELNLTTHAELMQGGEDGQVIMPGDATNSMLWQLIDEGKMPRRQPKLPQKQIDMIGTWINQGAQDN